MDRRGFLRGFGAIACSAAAHPFLSTVTLAQGAPALGENRLIVVILRGAMDGLDVVQPRFDPAYAGLRPGLAASPALALGAGEYETTSLLRLLTAAPPAELAMYLNGTPAQPFCQEGNEKMLANTRAIIGTYLSAWSNLTDNGSFSVRDWIRAEGGMSWLFITYRDDQFALLRPLISTWLDLAIVEGLALDEDQPREIWFVMDEVDSLGKISNLRQALTKLRKYGCKCVLGLQTVSQLRSTYGKDEAQTLMANIGTKIVLRAGDGETAEYFSAEFGSQEIQRVQKSASKASGVQFTKTQGSAEVRETRRTVLDSEIAGLDDLHGYLKAPGALVPIELQYLQRDRVTSPYVPRGEGHSARAEA